MNRLTLFLFRRLTFLLILLFSGANLFSQATQELEAIKKELSAVIQEKVFIHTDREYYITGETVWLKAYVLDPESFKQSDISKVLNIELIAASGNAVKQVRIELSSGLGQGQIFIDPSIASGSYELVGYTNWMRNFSKELVFKKRLQISNPVHNNNGLDPVAQESSSIQYYPEGGNLVEGLQSRVAVRHLDNFGRGIKSKLFLNNRGERLKTIETNEQGYGEFTINPSNDAEYEISYSDAISERILVKESGVVLALKNKDNQTLIELEKNWDSPTPYFVILHSKGKIRSIKPIYLEKTASIAIDKSELTPGVNVISLLDQKFNIVARRFFFKNQNLPISKGQLVHGRIFRTREKVEIAFEQFDEDAKLSISVFKSDTVTQQSESIISSVLLSSELAGQIQVAEEFLGKTNGDIDLLMLSHSFDQWNFKNMVESSELKMSHIPEYRAPLLTGQIKNSGISNLQLSIGGRGSVLSSDQISNDSTFQFEVPFRIRSEQIHFFADGRLVSDQLVLDSPFSFESISAGFTSSKPDSTLTDLLNSYYRNIQISQIYRSKNHINGLESKQDSVKSHFFGVPKYTYMLDDYTRFESMEDLFIEYILSKVYIKRSKGVKSLQVVTDYPLEGESLTMIDGTPISDIDFLFSFNPLLVERVEVIDKTFYVGDMAYGGMINFSTYKGDFGNQDYPEYLIEKIYHALQLPREFYSPDYESIQLRESRIPDYRNTLYWNPSVDLKKTDTSSVEFFTPDDYGTYRIVVQGVTENGQLVSITSGFSVVR